MKWREPEPREIRRSGYAYFSADGYINKVPSCRDCAKIIGVSWMGDLFEGQCRGCECALSGFPV